MALSRGDRVPATGPGPRALIQPSDLHHLKSDFKFATEFCDATKVSLAARFRVAHREALSDGGLHIDAGLRQLDAAFQSSQFLVRSVRWRDWFHASFLANVDRAVRDLQALGITIRAIEQELAGHRPCPWPPAICRKVHKGVQRATHARLRVVLPHRCPETFLRHRLRRWQLPLFPRIFAQRAARMLRRLAGLVAPRVWAAVFRSLLNGWCTLRRFQSRGRCVFGCSFGEDSLDHYLGCSVLARFGRDHLRLPFWTDLGDRRTDCLLLRPASSYSDASLVCGALRLGAAYRLHCRLRHSPARWGARDSEEQISRALAQMVKELAAGDRMSLRVLADRWHRSDAQS